MPPHHTDQLNNPRPTGTGGQAGQSQAPDFSVIIVSYNVAALLEECLKSILDRPQDGFRVEIIVVDNASHDGSPALVREMFPQVRLIENKDNYGFPRGCNQGLRQAKGRYLFFLNPDARLEPGVLKTLNDFMEANPACGIAGPKILYPDGTVQPNRRRFPGPGLAFVESTILQRYRPFRTMRALQKFNFEDVTPTRAQPVDWLVGAAFVVRREVTDRIGGLDEQFFMYSEEMDFCKRAKAAGWQVWYTPDATVIHQEGQSSKQDVPFRHINFQTSKIAYFRKHYGRLYGGLLRYFLLGTYISQYVEEWAKLRLGHKAELRRERLALIRKVLASGLRPYRSPFPPAPGELNLTLLSAEFPPLPGGVGDYTACLAAALQTAGAGQVRVLTGQSGLAADAEELPFPVERLPANRQGRNTWGWPALPRIAARLKGQSRQVLNIQYQTGAYRMHPAINFLPLYLRLTLGKTRPRVVTTFHDLLVPYLFPKAGPVREWVNRLLLKTSDLVIVTNASDYRQALDRGLDPARLRLVPIGSNIEPGPGFANDLERAVFRRGLGLNATDFAVGYFGLANRTKGIDTLLRALAELRATGEGQAYKLVLIGGEAGQTDPDNRAYAAELAALTGQLGLEGAVIRTGHRPAHETSRLLYALEAVALPFKDGASFRRGSLLAPLSHGLPVVTTWPQPEPANSCLPEDERLPQLLDGQNILLVKPDDPAGLAAALLRLRQEADNLSPRLNAGALDLARRFSWQSIGQRSLALYRKLFEN